MGDTECHLFRLRCSWGVKSALLLELKILLMTSIICGRTSMKVRERNSLKFVINRNDLLCRAQPLV